MSNILKIYREFREALFQELQQSSGCSKEEFERAIKLFGLDAFDNMVAHLTCHNKKDLISELRELSGASMRECQTALMQNGWNVKAAYEVVRE